MQTNTIWLVSLKRQTATKMRPTQRQLSACRLNKCNDDVEPNGVIIPHAKRRESPGLFGAADPMGLRVKMRAATGRCEVCCVAGFDVL